MSDTGTGNGNANNDWVAEKLEKARAEYEAAKKTKYMKDDVDTYNKVAALERVIYWKQDTRDRNKTKAQLEITRLNKKRVETNKKLETARADYKEIYWYLYGERSKGFSVKESNTESKWYKNYVKATGKMPTTWRGRPDGEFKEWLLQQMKQRETDMKNAKADIGNIDAELLKCNNTIARCDLATRYVAKYGQPIKGNSNTATLESTSNPEHTDGSVGNPVDGNAGGNQAKEEVLQTDENGNKLIRITDANGNQSYVVEDKDKKRTSINNDETKTTNVKPEDIQEAIQKGDWKTLLALFLKVISERAQQTQTVDGQAHTSADQTALKSTEYRTEDGDVFTVTKDGENITSISMQENGKTPFSLTAEQLKKYGANPNEVEQWLKDKQFNRAGGTLVEVGYKTETIIRSPEIEVKGNDIVLKDHRAFTGERKEPLVLNEKYLVEKCGMKESKAKKAMENLRVLAKSDNMELKQKATMIVAQYFSTESPAPKLLDDQATYGSPKLNRNPGGKIISITVKDSSGKEKELGYKDFAKAFGCSPEEAKKLRKECVRAIQNGKDVNGVLSFVAGKSDGKSKFWTNTATKLGTYVVGAAAAGVGAYAAFGGFKKKGDNTTLQALSSVLNPVETGENTDYTTTTKTTPTGDKRNHNIPFVGQDNTR